MNKIHILTMFRFVVGFWLLFWLTACDGTFKPPQGATGGALQSVQSELAIVGYNYTAKYIDSFDVGTAGAGNLYLSNETSGGGGITCCFTFYPDVGPRTVKVEWTDDLCKYNVRTHSNGETSFDFHRRLRSRLVEIATPAPLAPKFLEVHFYPDGKVQAALTESISKPRIVLSRSRGGPLPICPNNIKPR